MTTLRLRDDRPGPMDQGPFRFPGRTAAARPPRLVGVDDPDIIANVEDAMAQAELRLANLRALVNEFGLPFGDEDGPRAA